MLKRCPKTLPNQSLALQRTTPGSCVSGKGRPDRQSGPSAFFTGANRRLYLKSSQPRAEKASAILMPPFLVLIGLFYLLYSLRLFFVKSSQKDYSIILAITLALLSFLELGVAIHQMRIHRKNPDMTVVAFLAMNLSLAIFIAHGYVNDFANGLFGPIAGSFAIALGIALFLKVVLGQMM